MNQKYIATWFYKEDKTDTSFYPQVGRNGASELVHSIYMQIQVPFFATFRHYNPTVKLLFFTNAEALPSYLENLFAQLNVEVIRLSYHSIPPKGWHNAWRNQFYLYDIWKYMETRMSPEDQLLICDADCLCNSSLDSLFDEVAVHGSALYELSNTPSHTINGISLMQMSKLYEDCYQQAPSQPIYYYGGEFIALRGDIVKKVNDAYQPLWKYNLHLFQEQREKLNEEALFFSVLAERLQIRNNIANKYVKRMWTLPKYNNVEEKDEQLTVWHLPYEKKRGLYHLFKLLQKNPFIEDEQAFHKKASFYTGVPTMSLRKRLKDFWSTSLMKLKS